MIEQQLDEAILEAIATLIVVLDRDGKIVRFNSACERLTGKPESEVTGKCVWDLFLPAEQRAWAAAAFADVLDGSSTGSCDSDWITPQGLRRIRWTNSHVTDANGQTSMFVCAGIDITEQFRDQEALRATQEQFRAAFDDAAIGMAMTDLNGHFQRVNGAYSELTGYREEELLGLTFADITHPADRESSLSLARRMVGGEVQCGKFDKRYVKKDGAVVWVHAGVSTIHDGSGKPAGWVALVEDVSERMRAEQALRESEERFRQLAGAIDGVFWMVDTERNQYLYVSPAYERLWGRSLESLRRNPKSFLEAVHPEDRATVLRMMARSDAHEVEYRIIRPDQSVIWIRDRVFPIVEESGKAHRVCGIAEDVTERKRTEQAVRAMNEHLEQLVSQRTAAAQEQSRILGSVLQSMGEAVIVADPQGNVMLTNSAAARIAGPPDPDPHTVESCAQTGRFYHGDAKTPYRPEDLPLARAVRGEQVDDEEMLIARDDKPEGVWISATARPIRDESGRLAGGVLVARDTTERRRSERLVRESERHYREVAEHNRLLVQEVEHRVRNNLAGLLGLVSMMQERVKDVKTFAAAIEGRLRAMAHVHQLLAKAEWRSLDLRFLVESAIASMDFLSACPAEAELEGARVLIPPRRVLPLTLILLEWLTNSCKYGAHSAPGGRLRVGWEAVASPRGQRVRLCWKERGGPQIDGPVAPSLGTELVHAFASRELSGRCEMRFPSDGAEHHLEFLVGHRTDVGRDLPGNQTSSPGN